MRALRCSSTLLSSRGRSPRYYGCSTAFISHMKPGVPRTGILYVLRLASLTVGRPAAQNSTLGGQDHGMDEDQATTGYFEETRQMFHELAVASIRLCRWFALVVCLSIYVVRPAPERAQSHLHLGCGPASQDFRKLFVRHRALANRSAAQCQPRFFPFADDSGSRGVCHTGRARHVAWTITDVIHATTLVMVSCQARLRYRQQRASCACWRCEQRLVTQFLHSSHTLCPAAVSHGAAVDCKSNPPVHQVVTQDLDASPCLRGPLLPSTGISIPNAPLLISKSCAR